MKNLQKLAFLFIFAFTVGLGYSQNRAPFLKKQGTATQLIVDDKPFIILGGELGNSTASTSINMKPVWPKLKAMNMNTVLVPVYWELLEPSEGQFDYSLLKDLISEARQNKLKIVFLWFGCWKNSMSSHAPAWVKLNQDKYPRAKDKSGRSQEILSAFSNQVFQADRKAFENLMRFIKDFDSREHTVLMIQVENEIGMLPSARDYQLLAEDVFRNDIPKELLRYMKENKDKLVPEFRKIWEGNGFRTSGTWEEVFGQSLQTDEIFTAWNYAVFANKIAEVGKKVYSLPMYVNAALNGTGKVPGQYPSGGPLPHLMDVWKAAGNSIDFLSPDFYNPDFSHWCDLYTRQNNPLFVPEHAMDQTIAAKSIFAIANYEALGFSPFSVESTTKPEDEPLGKMYDVIGQLTPVITSNQGQGKIKGVLLSKSEPSITINFGKYEITCKHDYTLSWTPGARIENWPMSGAAIIQTGNDEFYFAGTGVVFTFKSAENKDLNVGLLKVDEGSFDGGEWKVSRHLNGDQTHQGRHVSIPVGEYSIQRVKLYTYK